MIIKCPECKKYFKARKHGIRGHQKYCGLSCKHKVWGKLFGGKNKKEKIIKKCLVCNKQIEICPSLKNKRKFCSRHCMGLSRLEHLKKARSNSPTFLNWFGINNPRWKGGITPKNTQIRNSKKYKGWREIVFMRDNYTCQNCKTRGGKLQVHHIKTFAKYPDLRFNINNAITLCITCHKETDSYLNK